MKRALSLILALVMALTLVACGNKDGGKDDSFVIGITTFSTSTVFSRNAREVLKKEITAHGGTYIDNVATDILSRDDAINNFVSQGVNAIILLSGDVSECEESLQAAHKAGILIGSCDAGYIDCVDIYTSSDNYAIGEQVMGALSEAMGGEGKVLVTLGTGIGSGIVLGGRIYSGLKGNGAEMGHMMLQFEGSRPCFCGRRGCWDAYASATALVHQAEEAAREHPESLLSRLDKIDGKSVFDAADRGDVTAQVVLERYCRYLAVGISNIVNALAPEMILVGGGISRQGDRILTPVREYVAQNCFDKRPEALPVIAPAQMGNEAGIVGAAALAE